MIRACGTPPTAGSDELCASLCWNWHLGFAGIFCTLRLSGVICAGMGIIIFSVCWNGPSASCLCTQWNFSSGVLVSSAERALGSPGSRASFHSTSCLYCRVREGPEWAAGEGVLAGCRIYRNCKGTAP